MRVLLSLLLLLGVSYVSSQQQCPNAFNLGTATGLSDVVTNCVTQSGWSATANHPESPLNTTLDFVATIGSTFTVQTYVIQFAYLTPDVLRIDMDPLQQAGTIVAGTPLPLRFKFTCLDKSGNKDTIVSATFRFLEPSTTSPVTITFQKFCSLPPLQISSVGSNAWVDVASGGIPVSNFFHIATSDIATEDFFIWLPSGLGHTSPYPYWNFSTITTTSGDKKLLPNVTYSLSSNQVLPIAQSNATRLTVNYICDNTQPAGSTTVTVAIDIGYDLPLSFQYYKNCSYGNGQVDANVFYVQLSRTKEMAVSGGVVSTEWGRSSGRLIEPNEHEVDFNVWISGQTRAGKTELPFTVTTTVTNGNTRIMVNDGSTAPRPYTAIVNTTASTYIIIPSKLTCLNPGEGTGTIRFDFDQQLYKSIQIHFQYICSFPKFNIDFLSQDGSSVVSNLVINGVAQQWNYISPVDRKTENFRISLDPSNTYPVQDFTFENVTYDKSVVDPHVSPAKPWFPVSTTSPQAVVIVLTCQNDQIITSTRFSVQINYGWNTYQYIAFDKICGPTSPTSAPSSSSSGWSAAGIFFFTVFILTLVGCLTGAGYKYAKEDKRGWDVIPGITYYRSCYESACPTKRYTPQTDYLAENGPDHGGKSYQTDL